MKELSQNKKDFSSKLSQFPSGIEDRVIDDLEL